MFGWWRRDGQNGKEQNFLEKRITFSLSKHSNRPPVLQKKKVPGYGLHGKKRILFFFLKRGLSYEKRNCCVLVCVQSVVYLHRMY